MAHIFDSLYPCSFNGVGFLVESSSIAGGRKNVTHEFPNQDNRYVEDLGLLNETITLNACIPTKEYFSGRDALKFALELGGYGTLIHPFYGIRTCAVKSYTIAEDTSSLGDVKITMVFEVAQELNFPGGGIATSGAIIGLVAAMGSSANLYYTSNYSANQTSGRAVVTLLSTMNDVGASFVSTTSNYTTRTTFLSTRVANFQIALNTFLANTSTYTVNPTAFSLAATELYNTADLITDEGRYGFAVARGLFNFDPDPVRTTPITQTQVATEYSRQMIITYNQILSFGLMAKNAAIIPYNTLNEYNTVRADLDEAYLIVKTRLSTDPSASDLLNVIEDVRTTTISYLVKAAEALPFINTIQGRNLPLSVLTFQYYGSTDKVDFLQTLNFPTQIDPSLLEGEVDILSGV